MHQTPGTRFDFKPPADTPSTSRTSTAKTPEHLRGPLGPLSLEGIRGDPLGKRTNPYVERGVGRATKQIAEQFRGGEMVETMAPWYEAAEVPIEEDHDLATPMELRIDSETGKPTIVQNPTLLKPYEGVMKQFMTQQLFTMFKTGAIAQRDQLVDQFKDALIARRPSGVALDPGKVTLGEQMKINIFSAAVTRHITMQADKATIQHFKPLDQLKIAKLQKTMPPGPFSQQTPIERSKSLLSYIKDPLPLPIESPSLSADALANPAFWKEFGAHSDLIVKAMLAKKYEDTNETTKTGV
jgi:hypothetical protein